MATAQGQDIIACPVCEDPVEFHCNPCSTDLCSNCVLIHFKDSTKKHEVVKFSDKICSLIFPNCNTHKNKCETYCNDCKLPVCIKCITDSHKGHDFMHLENLIEMKKKQINSDIEEQRTMLERYQRLKFIELRREKAFDMAIKQISKREEEVVMTIREASEKMKLEVLKRKTEKLAVNSENNSKISEAEQELQEIMKWSEKAMQSRFAIDIINYCSKDENNQENTCNIKNEHLVFSSGLSVEDQIPEILGSLCYEDAMHSGKWNLVSFYPTILKTIQSPYAPLWRTKCAHNGNFLTSGNEKKIREIGTSGNILQVIGNADSPGKFTINEQGDILFVTFRPCSTIYIYTGKGEKTKRFLCLDIWALSDICFARNGNYLFVSMRFGHNKQGRIAKFCKDKEVLQIQYDNRHLPLFSMHTDRVLLLNENGNGNICVSDSAGEAVVVLNASGRLRFKYKGNTTNQSKYNKFSPFHIASNASNQILISEIANNIVHIIDCDGNFLFYLEYPCDGGLSIDADHNLVVGEEKTGLIRIIKYLDKIRH